MKEYTYVIHGLFVTFVSSNRQSMIDAALCMSMAMLHGIYRSIRLRRCFLDAAMCALFAWVVRDAIMLMGWELKWADIISVLIGFLGIDYIGSMTKSIISKLINAKGGGKG